MSSGTSISSIVEWLEVQVVERAGDSAVVTPTSSITYGELGQRVAELSTTIVHRCPETDWLPILVDRSIESVIAVLAAIRAGRAFAPIEDSQPQSRIAELFARCGNPPVAVVPRSDMARILPTQVQPVGPERVNTPIVAPVPIDSSAPGTLIFTSGSTGSPKGVVRLWSATDGVRARRVWNRDASPQRTAQIRPLSFSGGLNETLRVSIGDTLLLVDPRTRSIEQLFSWLAQEHVSEVTLGPHLTESLVRQSKWRLPDVRTFSVGGTSCDWSDVARIREICAPGATIVNQYSATEVGLVAHFTIEADQSVRSGSIPVGGIDGYPRVRLEPVAEGHEIWVRDPYSSGYLNDPALTSERYVVDGEGTTWWRSKDIGRVDEVGLLHLAGRSDDMVKINGMRVEPMESELALRSVRGVSAAAVLPHRTSRGEHRLIGHVCVDDPTLTPRQARQELEKILPSHLIPAFFVLHDELPYNERLKLDRHALVGAPLERWRSTPPIHTFHEPVMWLTGKIQEIIGLGDVAQNDDVWEAGLDSMGAVELASAIEAQGLGNLDPVELLRYRTPIAVERHLSSARTPNTSPAVEFHAGGSRPAIFAVPGSGGTAFAFRSLAESLGVDQPLVVIEPTGMHCRGPIERSVNDRVTTALREISARLDDEQPCIVLGYSGGATFAVEIVRRLRSMNRCASLVLLDAAPRDGRHNAIPIDSRGRVMPPRPVDATLATQSRWMIERLRLAIQDTIRTPRNTILRLLPARRRYTREYYGIFKRYDRLALDRHQLQVFDLPTTLLHIDGSDAPQKCGGWITDLTCHQVGGDHFSMLHPPHVDQLARHIIDIRDRQSVTVS